MTISLKQAIDSCKLCEKTTPCLSMDRKVISRSLMFTDRPLVMIIGEAPGYNEYLEGKPFVGASGKLLQEFLDEYFVSNSVSYYITNTIKCRPEGNKDPSAVQKANCLQYLQAQVNYLKPVAIIALGSHAQKQIHGNLDINFNSKVFNFYHPAYLLYNGKNETLLNRYHETFQEVIDYVKGSIN